MQESDTKERQARAVVESRRLVDQHAFSVQKEAAKADAHLEKQQEAIKDCMVRAWLLLCPQRLFVFLKAFKNVSSAC